MEQDLINFNKCIIFQGKKNLRMKFSNLTARKKKMHLFNSIKTFISKKISQNEACIHQPTNDYSVPLYATHCFRC